MTLMLPPVGVSSPAISFNKVDFPDPLRPMRPVRPGPTTRGKFSRTGLPSGQVKPRPVQTMDAADAAVGDMDIRVS